MKSAASIALSILAAGTLAQSGYPGYGNQDMQKAYPGYGNPGMLKAYPGYDPRPRSAGRYVPVGGYYYCPSWKQYRSGYRSRRQSFGTFVIQNSSDWKTYWQDSLGADLAKLPKDIDWRSEQLIAIHLGQRNSGGYTVRVEALDSGKNGETIIRYREYPPGGLVTQELTSPFVIVRLPRAAGKLRFEKLPFLKRTTG